MKLAMRELINEIKQVTESELKRAKIIHPPFVSSHEAYGVIAEEIDEAEEAFVYMKGVFADFFRCVRKNDFTQAYDYLARVKSGAIDCAAEMVQVAAGAQKAIDNRMETIREMGGE